ncbi:tRNA cyclic N6-threonylcarbamoyladenosine(37) synthase TcdA [Ectothiorhodospira shaposhnikovii]|uniref:tRNA threonylcarbamoyladenosine dehydratase n=1 Tax=Ectothiorhodospira shaposhnikovii TaxID=1054 RepID=UPI0019074FDC|nr:tRNA threonylcarbamoyladenosine dehydratase [Ectothiorhodospira shaposhnikovii]MBK1675010.1 tRNA cyclic N6-threonylcarbamoyladenosine(37) synthase TcdA [Ectothiorhodospira shaposhnikovii]
MNETVHVPSPEVQASVCGSNDGRRFGGIARLYGKPALDRLARSRVCVVGIGGVGSWAVEALARSGVGALTLVDLDHVAESNINRQIHALEHTLGASKVKAMSQRVQEINPRIVVREVEDFITRENARELIAGADAVVDAVDHVRAKIGIVLACREAGVPVIMAGAAGGKKDPGRICLDDLSRTEHDALLAKVRRRLRSFHGFPRDPRRRFGIPAIFSMESGRQPSSPESEDGAGPQGLSCSGYGSSMAVTATMGLRAAAWALDVLVTSPSAVADQA